MREGRLRCATAGPTSLSSSGTPRNGRLRSSAWRSASLRHAVSSESIARACAKPTSGASRQTALSEGSIAATSASVRSSAWTALHSPRAIASASAVASAVNQGRGSGAVSVGDAVMAGARQ